MTAAEFAVAYEALVEQEQAACALLIVANDLDAVTTAKERGRWLGFLEARNLLHAALKALTADPAAQAEPPKEQEAMY